MKIEFRKGELELHIECSQMPKDRLAMLLNYAIGTLAIVMAFVALYMLIGFIGR